MKRGWNALLEFISDSLLIAFGLVLLYQFVTISVVGWYGFEPHKYILWAEIGMAGLIFLIGVNRFVNDLKHPPEK